MAVTAQSQSQSGLEAIQKHASGRTFIRVIRYTGLRLVTLFITVVIGIYLTILIANMGGYVDNIMKGRLLNPSLRRQRAIRVCGTCHRTNGRNLSRRRLRLRKIERG